MSLVVAYHAGIPGFSGGFVGVDVFFVISGFLITRILLEDARRHGTIDFGDFYARRIRRILPALIVVVLFTMAAVPSVSLTTAQVELASASAVAALFFYANFFFWNQAESYFAPQLDLHPLLHTWSLAIEEQFYMVWPLALFGLVIAARRFRWNLTVAATWFFVVVLIASLIFSVSRTATHPIAAFYLMPSRAWELATGALLVVNANRLQRLPESWRSVLRAAGLTGIAVASTLFSPATPFPGVAAILPVASTALVIASVEGAAPRGRGPVLTWRPVVFIGLLSYSWYLWHWPLLTLRRMYYIGVYSLVPDMLMCAIGLALAYVTYRYVETPVRTMQFTFLRQRRWTFAFGVGLLVTGFAAARGAAIVSSHQTPSRLADAEADAPPLQRRCNPLGRFRGFPTPESVCTDGAAGAPVGVVAWGDSHAGHLMPMLGESLRALQLTALQRTRHGCPPLLNAAPIPNNVVNFECVKFNAAVLEELTERKRRGLRGVVVNARWAMYLTSPTPNPRETHLWGLMRVDTPADPSRMPAPTLGVPPYDRGGSTRTMQQSLRDTFDELGKIGLPVIVVAPTPEMRFLIPHCLARRNESMCLLPRTVVEQRRAPALDAIRAAANGLAHVTVWDPIDSFCDSETCYAARDGIVIFTDEDHLTATWSRRLATDFRPAMERLVR